MRLAVYKEYSVEIVENLANWYDEYRAGWLAHYQQTGQTDFQLYKRPKNENSPGIPGINLAQSRLMFITTAGVYLSASQEPFDAENDLGDYSIRQFSSNVTFDQLGYAHTHYDHAAVNADPQVLMPLTHLRHKVADGEIGELAPSIISYCGYQPDLKQVVETMIPQIVAVALAEKVDGALVVPA